jgi:energy-coupling factor transporter ATP-binding protein EcfA2
MNWKGRKMFSSAVNMVGGGSVPYPSYQQGDLVMPAPLFEEGDQDINMALNTMASTTSPSVSDVKETVSMDMGAMGAMGEMPKDQGPSSFENALKNLKQDFYDEISGFVMKTKDMEKIQSYLKNMSVAYSNSLQKLKKEFGITEAFPNEQLLTPSFLTEIKNMLTAPGMQAGDLVGLVQKPEDLAQYGLGSFPWNVWQGLSDEEKQRLLKAGGSALLGTQQVDTTKQQQVMERINKIIEERKQLAGQSAVMPQTKQGGILGFATQVNALRAGQAAAKDKVLADELEMIRLGNQLGSRAQGQGPQFTATIRDAIFDDDEGPIIDKDEIYKQVMQQATDANFIRKLGNAALPSDYVSVQLAITGHGDIVDAHDESLAAIKTYKEAPTSFADYVIQRVKQDGGIFDPKESSVYVNEFRALPTDKGV